MHGNGSAKGVEVRTASFCDTPFASLIPSRSSPLGLPAYLTLGVASATAAAAPATTAIAAASRKAQSGE